MIELIITILIVGILSTMALPAYREFVASQRIKTASFDMMASLMSARSEAIKRNATVTITPAGGAWTSGWTVTAADGSTLSQQGALPGIAITCAPGACSAINYLPDGRVNNAQSLQMSSTSSARVRCISIGLSGRPISKTTAC